MPPKRIRGHHATLKSVAITPPKATLARGCRDSIHGQDYRGLPRYPALGLLQMGEVRL